MLLHIHTALQNVLLLSLTLLECFPSSLAFFSCGNVVKSSHQRGKTLSVRVYSHIYMR